MGFMDKMIAVAGIIKAVDNPDLTKAYIDLQNEAYKLTEKLEEKNEQIGQLKKTLELKGRMDIIDSVYWLTDEQKKTIDGPFCPKCIDVDHIQCRVTPLPSDFHPGVRCPNCKSDFESSLAITYIEDRKKNGQRKVLGR